MVQMVTELCRSYVAPTLGVMGKRLKHDDGMNPLYWKIAAAFYGLGALATACLFVAAVNGRDLWVSVFGGAALSLVLVSSVVVVLGTSPKSDASQDSSWGTNGH